MTITTTAPTTSSNRFPLPYGGGGIVALGLVFLCGRKRLPTLMSCVLLLGLGGIAIGCGGSGHKPPATNPGTPVGTSTVTITATGSGANPLSHATTVALTIQ
jgi:hypothetical protein